MGFQQKEKEVIIILNLPTPSSRIMALYSTQALIEIRIRNLPVGKGSRRVMLTAWLPSMSRFPTKYGNLTSHK
jgi:hypothetical protein